MKKSPNLVCRNRSSVLLVDVQEKLIPVIDHAEDLLINANRLLKAADQFEIPMIVSEQYPQGLGKTVPELSAALGSGATVFDKSTFSCRERKDIFEKLLETGMDQIILAGIEAHICVAQTCLDLLEFGFQVFVVHDAIGSRLPINKEMAIRRLGQNGAHIMATESVLFEWCEDSKDKSFKLISQWVK